MLKGACTFIMIKKKLFADSFCCWKGYRMTGKIALIPGDGIGPEIVAEAKKVLDTVAKNMDMSLNTRRFLWAAAQLMRMANR